MSTPSQPLPAGGRSREEIAQIEVDSTTIASATVRFLMTFFLTAIAAVPISEWVAARAPGAAGSASAWSRLLTLPGEIRSHVAAETASAEDAGVWRLVASANRIAIAGLSGFERSLEAESLLGRSLRPPAQGVMTHWLGVGNEQVYRGRGGWLFYRADVDYLTGRGFLDPAALRRRVAAAAQWMEPPQPDPREAIARFRRDLEAREIALVLMPTPLKPGIHPEMLAGHYADMSHALQNPSYGAFVGDMRRDGVLVFDPSEELASARRSGRQYLATDTHWRPEAMEGVAELLAGFIATHVNLPVKADPRYRIERPDVRNTGDLARMLGLPEDRPLFPPETVWLRRVLQPDGSPWRPSRDADVLMLGDSFSNIYSLESMGWGTSAGLVEQLSYALRRPIDRLVQNDEGAFATRAMLQRDPARLDGKRVVVYQFAARELAGGDWKVIRLPAAAAGNVADVHRESSRPVGCAKSRHFVSGRQRSNVPMRRIALAAGFRQPEAVC